MKRKLKIVILISVILFGYSAYSQTFIIKGGFNMSNQTDKNSTTNYSRNHNYKMLPGGHAGVAYDISLFNPVSIEAGVLVTTKGYNRDDTTQSGSVVQKSYLVYGEIPLCFKYSIKKRKNKLYFFAGGYCAYAIWGKLYTETIIANQPNKYNFSYNFGTDIVTDQYRHLDYGALGGVGGSLHSFSLEASYNQGIRNISTLSEYGQKIRNSAIYVTLAYEFGSNRKPLFNDL